MANEISDNFVNIYPYELNTKKHFLQLDKENYYRIVRIALFLLIKSNK